MQDKSPKNKEPLSPERLAQLKEASKKGGLAKRGKMSLRKINELKTKTAVTQRIYRMADKLLNAQVIAATGTHRMVVMVQGDDGKPRVEQVRDEARMQELLDTGIYGQDYFILAGADPDWKAAEALLNRGLGKAAETVKHDVNVKFSLTELAKRRAKLPPLALNNPIDTTYIEKDAAPGPI